ncbi:unnamed protein product [Nippostrongylus brasiliensis]|uniref:DDE_Tnp_1_7 domain-containing protein n=1 Tax=Nippostrongylus brasiliensis TaxID=27835 RepID=A0A0N4YRU3_NIPBR|nr:unnamed protein product [Nippostrongylus brasiliensis]
MKVMDVLLNADRRVFADNWYTRIPLAEQLIQRRPRLIGTIRSNRRGIPKHVLEKKLKRGSVVAEQNQLGVVVLKWKDKRYFDGIHYP